MHFDVLKMADAGVERESISDDLCAEALVSPANAVVGAAVSAITDAKLFEKATAKSCTSAWLGELRGCP